MSKNYWQVAAGSSGREYSDAFLRWGMAFVGGDTQLATMQGVMPGDIMILKSGQSQILAAGPVVERQGMHRGEGDKEWLKDFDGWDLQGYCYVDWHVPPESFETSGLTRATIQRTWTEEHHRIAEQIITNYPVREPDPEPKTVAQVSDKEILKFLIKRGLRAGDADLLTATFGRIRLLAEYYYNNCDWGEVREHETRSFLVIPLLLALGWAEQQIKIEYPSQAGRVDLICFSHPQHTSEAQCDLLLESKDFSKGLDYARAQAHSYTKSFPTCQVLVVTNGYCYKSYVRNENGEFGSLASAYLNITRPMERYPLDPDRVGGAVELLDVLMPGRRIT